MEIMTVLRIGYLSTFYHTSHLLMREDLKHYGLNLKWSLFGTGPAIVEAFQREELDLAYIGVPPALIGIDRGVDIVCIAGGHIEGTVIAGKNQFRPYPVIEQLQDLFEQFRGTTIGVPGKGSIHDVILKRYLTEFGLEKEVKIINFSWADEIIEEFKKDKLSVAIGTPALAICLKHFVGASVLWPPSLLWPYNPSYAIFARRDLIEKEKESLKILLKKHEEIAEFLRRNPDEAAEKIFQIVGPIVNHSEIIKETIMLSPKYCAKITKEYIDCTLEFIDKMFTMGYIKRRILPEEVFNLSLIDEIHPEEAHYNQPFSQL